MQITRRKFVTLTAGGIAATVWPGSAARPLLRSSPFKAIAFDAFPIFDPRPVFALAETIFPGRGTELSNLWRIRQFEYQWLRTLSGHFSDFWDATEDALVFAARQLKLKLTAHDRGRLMQSYLELTLWPDVASSLKTLREMGLRLALLSNMTGRMLETGIEKNDLAGLFEHVLSTDQLHTYKPAARAYEMTVTAFGLRKEEILYVAFAGWDVAGSKWAGYPVYWVNRLNAVGEELGVQPDAIGHDLDDLVGFLRLGSTSTKHNSRAPYETRLPV